MIYSVQNGLVPANVLAGEPNELAAALAAIRPVDAAEALNSLDRSVAGRVLEAMPVSAAVQILNEPHLDEPAKLIVQLPVDCAPAILTGLHPDRRAEIFRELSEEMRRALLPQLERPIRETLEQLLSYPPQSAGGLMTTDFVSVPADATIYVGLFDDPVLCLGSEAICRTSRSIPPTALGTALTGSPSKGRLHAAYSGR